MPAAAMSSLLTSARNLGAALLMARAQKLAAKVALEYRNYHCKPLSFGVYQLVTNDQFHLLVKLLRGNPESPATMAARLVLVDGSKQSQAAKQTGASPSNVHDAVERYRQAHRQILEVYDSEDCNYLPRGVVYGDEARNPAASNTRTNTMNVQLQVDWHPSGRRTLKERSDGARMWSDCRSPGLFGNLEPQPFYLHVQQYIDTLLAKGAVVEFTDCTTQPASSMGLNIKTERSILTLQNLDIQKLASCPEPIIVDTVAKLLQAHFPDIHTTFVSWLAYREAIELASGQQRYGKLSAGQVALHWVTAARSGKLQVRFDQAYGLKISIAE